MRTAKRGATLLALVIGALVIGAPTAQAASVGRSASTLTYVGGSEANSVSLSVTTTEYVFTDFGAGTVTAGSTCTASNGPAGPLPIVRCPRSGVTQILIQTGSGNDTAQVALANSVPAGVGLTVELGPGDDSWSGDDVNRDVVDGQDGDDSIRGNGGPDVLDGGNGIDTIEGGSGADELDGGDGRDSILGGPDGDRIQGGVGNDVVNGQTGDDVVRGGPGNDTVGGGLGPDTLYGDAGADRLRDDERGMDTPFHSVDRLYGGPGVDTADYSYRLSDVAPLRLSLDGIANDGAAGEGDNVATDVENLAGGLLADVLVGSSKANVLGGAEGGDTIRGLGGNDVLRGDSGNDQLDGGPGADLLEGWYGRDTVIGGSGSDALSGGHDADVMKARDGTADDVTCGSGVDRAEVDGRDRVNNLCDVVVR